MFEFEPEIDTLEGVPEQYHTLYTQSDEGKFTLDDKLAERLSNGAGAARGLANERKAKQAAERLLVAFRAIGETPEAIQERITELEGNADKVAGAEERVARVKADLERTHANQIKAKDEEIVGLRTAVETEQRQSDLEFLQREIADAVSATDAIPAALRPILRERVRIERDDEGRKIKVLDERGEQVLDGRGDPIGIKAFAEKLKANDDFGFAFKPTGTRGGGSNPGGGPRAPGGRNPFDPKTKNLTEQQELVRTNPDRARALAQAAGQPVNW